MADDLVHHMEASLASDATVTGTSLKMLVSYLDFLPAGYSSIFFSLSSFLVFNGCFIFMCEILIIVVAAEMRKDCIMESICEDPIS